MAPSYHSKRWSPIFLLFGPWNIVSHLHIQFFSDISSLPTLVVFQRFHENGKWILCVGKSKWFVYELSGCGIDPCYSNLNFRYCVCLGKELLDNSDNYRVYIHSKSVYVT